jgi:hypothetical protein
MIQLVEAIPDVNMLLALSTEELAAKTAVSFASTR